MISVFKIGFFSNRVSFNLFFQLLPSFYSVPRGFVCLFNITENWFCERFIEKTDETLKKVTNTKRKVMNVTNLLGLPSDLPLWSYNPCVQQGNCNKKIDTKGKRKIIERKQYTNYRCNLFPMLYLFFKNIHEFLYFSSDRIFLNLVSTKVRRRNFISYRFKPPSCTMLGITPSCTRFL